MTINFIDTSTAPTESPLSVNLDPSSIYDLDLELTESKEISFTKTEGQDGILEATSRLTCPSCICTQTCACTLRGVCS